MSVLAIDIGNSRIGFNVYTDGKALDSPVRLLHADLDAQLEETLETLWKKTHHESETVEDEHTGIVIVSVVPNLTERFERTIQETVRAEPRLIGRDIIVPLKNMLSNENTVGQDRLCGALAAYVNIEAACAVIHMGSALVVDCVDGEGNYRGGAIAPGLAMSAKALHEFAAQLPLVSLTAPANDVPFGRFTEEAINLGLFAAQRGAIRELLERYATALGAWPHVVATGGDAPTILGESESGGSSEGGGGAGGIKDLVQSHIPDLVLRGAALAWEHARNA